MPEEKVSACRHGDDPAVCISCQMLAKRPSKREPPAADAGPRQPSAEYDDPRLMGNCLKHGDYDGRNIRCPQCAVPQEAAAASGTVATFMDMRLDTTMPVGHSKGRRTIIPATAPDEAMRVARKIRDLYRDGHSDSCQGCMERDTEVAALIREAGSEREREAFESCAKELREHYNSDWDSTVPGAEFDAEILRILRKHLGRAGGE